MSISPNLMPIMDNLKHILVLRTNIQTKEQLEIIGKMLSGHPQILHWNIDTEDIDCVLRIVSPTLSYQQIIKIIESYGYFSCELIHKNGAYGSK